MRSITEYETLSELVKRSKLSRNWWYGHTRKKGPKRVPHIKPGKYLLFIPHEVDTWLKNQDQHKQKEQLAESKDSHKSQHVKI